MAFERSKLMLQTVGLSFNQSDVLAGSQRPISGTATIPQTDPKTHIVDQLIAERGGRLSRSIAWPLLRPLLYRFLHYKDAVKMADQMAELSARECMQAASDRLKLNITTRGLDNIPHEGPFIIVCNHPTGIADGVAMWDALAKKRADMTVFANRDAIRVSRELHNIIIPVEWREEFKTRDKSRETLRLTSAAIKDGRPIVVFPSGRIAYWANGGLNEREWQTSALTLARKYGLPVVPAHMTSRNSGLFYWLSKWSTELRDMTVFHELLNKQGSRFELNFGKVIPAEDLENGDVQEVTTALQNFCVHDLGENPEAVFNPPN
jgi:putative hemolysin